ncbi:hypothetical protein Tco_1226342 [Tanacetum coccineum]
MKQRNNTSTQRYESETRTDYTPFPTTAAVYTPQLSVEANGVWKKTCRALRHWSGRNETLKRARLRLISELRKKLSKNTRLGTSSAKA